MERGFFSWCVLVSVVLSLSLLAIVSMLGNSAENSPPQDSKGTFVVGWVRQPDRYLLLGRCVFHVGKDSVNSTHRHSCAVSDCPSHFPSGERGRKDYRALRARYKR